MLMRVPFGVWRNAFSTQLRRAMSSSIGCTLRAGTVLGFAQQMCAARISKVIRFGLAGCAGFVPGRLT